MDMEEELKQPKQRGGARLGAGRKPKDGVGSIHVSVRLNKNHVRLIRENYDNPSEFISKAVKEKLRREGLI
jgi:hypothetical protein